MNAQIKRPRRQRKGDRLLNPDARRVEIETDHAVAPFDRMAEQMDVFGFTNGWGFDINKAGQTRCYQHRLALTIPDRRRVG